jgi:hypothetical protein
MKPLWRWIAAVPLVLFLAIQLVPVDRSNPPVGMELSAPPQVQSVLRKSCYDCHSNETNWPWYAYVAPISWSVAGHVDHGRSHLNFSEWGSYGAVDQAEMIEEIWEEVEERTMPLPGYLRFHREALLSDDEVETIRLWTGGRWSH